MRSTKTPEAVGCIAPSLRNCRVASRMRLCGSWPLVPSQTSSRRCARSSCGAATWILDTTAPEPCTMIVLPSPSRHGCASGMGFTIVGRVPASLDARICSCMAPPSACRCGRRSARDVPRIQKSRQWEWPQNLVPQWQLGRALGSYTDKVCPVASVRAVSVCRCTAIAAVRGTLSTRRSRAARLPYPTSKSP